MSRDVPDQDLATMLPLRGVTLLAIGACGGAGLAQLCAESGARLRRAETARQAEAHLGLYSPDLTLVDLDLPGFQGQDLMARLAARTDLPLLGITADPQGLSRQCLPFALVTLPLPDLTAFQVLIQSLVRPRFPDRHPPNGGGRSDPQRGPARPSPQPSSWRPPLRRSAPIAQSADRPADWLCDFLSGIARQAVDPGLAAASAPLPSGDLRALTALLMQRRDLAAPTAPTRRQG